MKRLVMLLGVGATAFAISAVSSLYFGGGLGAVPQEQSMESGLESQAQAQDLFESSDFTTTSQDEGQNEEPSNAILHPATPTPVLAEEVIQLAEKLRQELAQLKQRRQELDLQETRLRILYDDIRAERSAIDALRKQIDRQIALLREQVAQLQEEQRQLAEQKKAFEERVIAMSDSEAANVRKMAEIFNSMSPDAAALVLEKMANNGNIDTAVQVLARMEPRSSAKVLAEMSDPALAAQLSERLKDLQPVQTATNTER